MLGMVSSGYPYKGTIGFSDTSYWTLSSYPSYVYNENSKLYSYVENYKTYLSTLGVTPIKARLISYEELIALGCNASAVSCTSAPSWVYVTPYWSGSVASSGNVWYVSNNGDFENYYYQYNYDPGVRPVIVIDKSLL